MVIKTLSKYVVFLLALLISGPVFALTPGTDSRVEIQALLDATPAGGTLTLPDGEYPVSRAGSLYYSLHVPAGVTVRGSGATIIKQADGTAASVRVFQMDGAGAALERLTIDGNYAAQTPDEHRAGVFITAADVTIRDLVSRNFTGDGIYVYTGADRAFIARVIATGNQRNGITIAGGAGVTVVGGLYAGNLAQQVDSEPGTPNTVDDVTIANVTIDAGASTQYALTISGSSATYKSAGWRVTGCVITGGINIVWADDVFIASNMITLPDAKALRVYRNSSRITIARNTLYQTNAALSYPSAIFVVGTGTDSAPSDVVITGNSLFCNAPSSLGIRLEGILSASVVDNVLVGADSTFSGASGIYVRTTNISQPISLVTILGNSIIGFGQRGVDVRGNLTATITKLRIIGNAIGENSPPQTVGVVLDDGLHPVQSSDLLGNVYGTGVTSGRLGE